MNKFLEEILEQPATIERTLAYYTSEQGLASMEKAKKVIKEGDFEQIIFTGMGSSYFTSFAAANLFNSYGVSSFVINASELLHYNLSLLEKKTILICFSQSGESFEIREVLDRLPESTYCIGIMNEEDSTLSKKSDIALFSKSGKEEMTSTKTFISTQLVSYILGWYITDNWNAKRIDMVKNLIGNLQDRLTNYDSEIDHALDFMGDLAAVQIIARGASYASASQSGLMFKEANKIAGTGILGGEFRHGPMEAVQEGFRAILFACQGKTYEQNIKMAEDIAKFGGKVILLTNVKLEFESNNLLSIFIDEQDEYLFSLLSIIPVQLFIDGYAKRRGYEAGSFSRGAKVTMVE